MSGVKKAWYEQVVEEWGPLRKPDDLLGLRDIEALYVARILHHTEGNITKAARLLQIGRRSLQRKIPKLRRFARKRR